MTETRNTGPGGVATLRSDVDLWLTSHAIESSYAQFDSSLQDWLPIVLVVTSIWLACLTQTMRGAGRTFHEVREFPQSTFG